MSLTLTEKYRPHHLSDVRGQERVVQVLKGWLRDPFATVMLFAGDTGTGKTSAALALAADLGCVPEQGELGGVHVIASGEQNADGVRDAYAGAWVLPMVGSGWKTVIVNEADRMTPAAETVWLDRLERLPPRTVIVFTTNHPDKLSDRFRDRCLTLTFDSNPNHLAAAACALLGDVWLRETGARATPASLARLVNSAAADGKFSFRRALQLLLPELLIAQAMNQEAPQCN